MMEDNFILEYINKRETVTFYYFELYARADFVQLVEGKCRVEKESPLPLKKNKPPNIGKKLKKTKQ